MDLMRELSMFHFMAYDTEFIKHCPPKVKVQPALLFSSFMHNSSINEHISIKLRENICYQIIN